MRADAGSPRGQVRVRLEGASKTYADDERWTPLRRRPGPEEATDGRFDALRDVDLVVGRGERVGIIGPNGAGKTTLLRLVAGVTEPSEGRVEVAGSVTSMIDLGLGFHPDLSGWHNIECSGVLLGMTRAGIRQLADPIAEFSGIGDVLDRPLRTYSAGMRARLGFAVATHVPCDVLVVDEVLAVGDREFQIACIERIGRLGDNGTTLLFVSHEMPLITQVCSRAVHVRHGGIVDDGPAVEVVERYLEPSPSRMRPMLEPPMRLVSCELVREQIAPWEPVEIVAEIEVLRDGAKPRLGVDMTLPTFDPDYVFLSTTDDLAGISGAGRYRVRGRSEPYPGDSGLVRVAISLVDGDSHRLADQRSVEFSVPGGSTSLRPRLALQPRWSIEVVESLAPAVATPRVPAGRRAASLSDVVKRYRTRTDRGSDRDRPGSGVVLGPCTLDFVAGEVTGVIGPNGAGKTTMLRLLAGVTRPEEGDVEVSGRVVPVLDLGLGFHPELSALENLRVAGALLGVDDAELQEALPGIIDLSGLGPVMDRPVRTFSTGMVARLGFALAVRSRPDVLLLDEILAVGDADFRRRAVREVRRLAAGGATVVFVSHDLGLVEEICDRVVRLDRGMVVDDDEPAAVVERFGGRGWSAGSLSASADVRVLELQLVRRQLPANSSLEFTGLIEVDRPSPHARVELSLRVPLDDRTRVVDRAEFESRCFFVSTVEPAGGTLSTPGRYRFEGSLERIPFAGVEMDVVVSVVDRRDGVVISEHWQEAAVGQVRPGQMPRPLFRVDWHVERDPDAARA